MRSDAAWFQRAPSRKLPSMSCDERRRLLMAYALAVEQHVQASSDWITCLGCVSKHDYDSLKMTLRLARLAVQETRLKYLEHSEKHGCHALAGPSEP